MAECTICDGDGYYYDCEWSMSNPESDCTCGVKYHCYHCDGTGVEPEPPPEVDDRV